MTSVAEPGKAMPGPRPGSVLRGLGLLGLHGVPGQSLMKTSIVFGPSTSVSFRNGTRNVFVVWLGANVNAESRTTRPPPRSTKSWPGTAGLSPPAIAIMSRVSGCARKPGRPERTTVMNASPALSCARVVLGREEDEVQLVLHDVDQGVGRADLRRRSAGMSCMTEGCGVADRDGEVRGCPSATLLSTMVTGTVLLISPGRNVKVCVKIGTK